MVWKVLLCLVLREVFNSSIHLRGKTSRTLLEINGFLSPSQSLSVFVGGKKGFVAFNCDRWNIQFISCQFIVWQTLTLLHVVVLDYIPRSLRFVDYLLQRTICPGWINMNTLAVAWTYYYTATLQLAKVHHNRVSIFTFDREYLSLWVLCTLFHSVVWCDWAVWFWIVSVSKAESSGLVVRQCSITRRDSTFVQIHKAYRLFNRRLWSLSTSCTRGAQCVSNAL